MKKLVIIVFLISLSLTLVSAESVKLSGPLNNCEDGVVTFEVEYTGTYHLIPGKLRVFDGSTILSATFSDASPMSPGDKTTFTTEESYFQPGRNYGVYVDRSPPESLDCETVVFNCPNSPTSSGSGSSSGGGGPEEIVTSCSYPYEIDCTERDDVDIITNEWQEGKCSRDELGECIEIWSNTEEEEEIVCAPNWDCKYFICINQKMKVECKDGCGNNKIEYEKCSIVEEDNCNKEPYCYWGGCVNGKRIEFCYDECGIRTESRTVNCEIYEDTRDCDSSLDTYPIIFVHGFRSNGEVFNELETELKKGGYCSQMYKVNTYENKDCETLEEYGIEEHAKKLKQEIEDKFPNQKVNIIAHSMGGLTARYYIRYLSGEENVNKLIMLATPNKGAIGGATFLWRDASCPKRKEYLQCLTGSPFPFLKNLNSKDETWGEVIYFTISTKGDNAVYSVKGTPTGSKVDLEGAFNFPYAECSTKDIDGGHSAIIEPKNCPKALSFVLETLKKNPELTQYEVDEVEKDSSSNEESNDNPSITGNQIQEKDTSNNAPAEIGEVEQNLIKKVLNWVYSLFK